MINAPLRFLPCLFIALAGLSLLLGLSIGVTRLGFTLPLPSSARLTLHGPLMAIGFLLTWLGLERAAASERWWVYSVPLLSVLCVVWLLFQLPILMAVIFAAVAALLLTVFFLELYRRQRHEHFVIMALSAALLTAGNLLWLSETTIHHIVPWWAGFVVLTSAGERLELTRLVSRKLPARWLFRIAVIIFVAGLVVSNWQFRLGVRIAGAGLIALALWLLRHDLPWQNISLPGLPRFMATCLIAGYLWLVLGGVSWIWFARFFGAGPLYDAMLHTVFLGFVFSMIFAHAPIILPSITQLAMPFDKLFYLHAGLLHFSLAIRIAGDLALLPGGQKWGGLLNVVAVLLFFLNNFRVIVSARCG